MEDDTHETNEPTDTTTEGSQRVDLTRCSEREEVNLITHFGHHVCFFNGKNLFTMEEKETLEWTNNVNF